MSKTGQGLPENAIVALENGSKIEAIKYVREHQGVGLKEAKDLVEQFIETNPGVKSSMHAANVKSAKVSFRWLIVIVLVGIAAYKIFTGSD